MATLIFKKQEIIQKERAAVKEGLTDAAKFAVRDFRKALNLAYPPASLPGEYPRKRTGNLRKSIDWWFDDATMAAEVGANIDAPYWSDLEYGTKRMEERPFVRPRLVAIRSDLERITGQKLKVAFGGS